MTRKDDSYSDFTDFHQGPPPSSDSDSGICIILEKKKDSKNISKALRQKSKLE